MFFIIPYDLILVGKIFVHINKYLYKYICDFEKGEYFRGDNEGAAKGSQ